jgi:crotonobetainyl-CoA:carnitine CoA-transferase CaiB-like acyl-CoA transferase
MDRERTGPLSWMRVVELTDLRGALCGRILADLGADVLAVAGPGTAAIGEEAVAGRYRNANKKGVALDPRAPGGRRRLDELLAAADVLVENLDPGERDELGLDAATLEREHPQLVSVALTDLGLAGPRAGWRLEPLPALAASGALHASGFPDMPPCGLPGYLAHDCASVYGAVGAVAAVLDRARRGRGQQVEISVQEAALAGTTPWSLCLADYRRVTPTLPSDGARNADGSYWVLPASDGWVRTVIGSPRQWKGFVALLRNDPVLGGPEWDDSGFRLMNADVVRLLAEQRLTDRTRQQLFEEALDLGTTIGVLHRPSEFVAHRQTTSRSFFDTSGVAADAGAPVATFPVKLSRTPSSLHRPAPGPGASDRFDEARPSGRSAPLEGSLLLAGVRVVELGAAAVVPEMSGVLSELGAEVIRIESAAHPDVLRLASRTGDLNKAFAFNAENRGRESVVIDLGTEEGRELAFDLCTRADVVAENQRGGVMERLGLGYERVRAVRPDIIYASSQGYGRGGPLGEMPAYGPLNSGFAGVHLLWNHPDAPYPCGTSLNHPDHIAGKLLAAAVLAALDHRQRTGEGQHLDMAQTEAAAYLLGEVYLAAAIEGADPEPRGNRSPDAVPHGVYPSAGEDRWVAVVACDDAAFERLAGALGWEPDPAWATLGGRLAAREALDAGLAEWTSRRPAEEAAEVLQAAGVSAMPVMGPEDHHRDAHLGARGFIVTLEHPEVGSERHAGNPVRMSRLLQRTAASAPCMGADTAEVMRRVVGLAPAEIDRLSEAGVLR